GVSPKHVGGTPASLPPAIAAGCLPGCTDMGAPSTCRGAQLGCCLRCVSRSLRCSARLPRIGSDVDLAGIRWACSNPIYGSPHQSKALRPQTTIDPRTTVVLV
ncbi:hypothetical protein Ancab_039444, partial [Ancistrocladus abbreviatus]